MYHQVSPEEVNQYYGYRSFVPTKGFAFSKETQTLRMPLYRWDPGQAKTVLRSWRKHIVEYPLYCDWIQICNIVHFSFDETQTVTDHCEFYKLVYRHGLIQLDTDFPFPLVIRVSSWSVQVDKSDVVVGKCIEESTCFLIGEGVKRQIILYDD
jgi:hypothetical protein